MRRTLAALAMLAWAGVGRAQGVPPTPTPPPALGEPVTLDVKDADLRDVLLRRFRPRTGRNFVVDPDVKGTVTVRLDRVPFEQALDAVLVSNGWGWCVEGRIIRVGHPGRL